MNIVKVIRSTMSFYQLTRNVRAVAFSINASSTSKFLAIDTCPVILTNSVREFHFWVSTDKNFMKLYQVDYDQVRHGSSSFFTKTSAEQLWKSVASVSSAGRRRGRGRKKDRKVIRDLNKGQVIGIGKDNIRWPGLSAPVFRGREIVQREQLPPDEKYEENLTKIRDSIWKAKKFKMAAIDRGYSGGHAAGRRIGPPDPIGEETFSDFDTIILQQKPFVQQTSHSGRARTIFVICGTGNGKGLFGYSMAKTPDAKTAQRRAKNRAAQKLMYIPICDNRTVFHNFHSRFHNTKIYAWPKGPGYGLVCHRIIKSMCQLIGIKDLYVKIEGGITPLNIIRAFLIGLLRQKSFEELANETGYHVVQFDHQHNDFPQIMASPNCPIESSEEVPNFKMYCMDEKLFLKRKRLPPPSSKFAAYETILRKIEKRRSHFDTMVNLFTEYDEIRSFLTDTYTECKPSVPPWAKSVKEALKNETKEESK